MKKLLSLIILLFLMINTSCSGRPEDFQQFSLELFEDFLENDALSQAYILKDPSPYDFDPEDISLGSYEPEILADKSGLIAAQKSTRRFLKSNALSEEEEFSAKLLDHWLTGQIVGKLYYLYEEPFAATSGIQVNLPILLSEYPMNSKQDVENYLALLEDTEHYLESAFALEQEKSEAELFMSEEVLALCLAQIDRLTENSYDWLTEAFSRKLKEIPMTKEEQVSYLTRQITALQEDFYPAFENLKSKLKSLGCTAVNGKGLGYFPDGLSYYEHLVEYMVGSDKTPLQCKIRIQEELLSCFTHLSTVNDSELSTKITEYSLFSVDYYQIIHALETAILQDFPTLFDNSCTIFEVPSSMSDNVSPAFYLTARIDDPTENVIYINPKGGLDYISAFQTLAHEGYPGHLYQNVYFAQTKPHPLRAILSYSGYSEGWATFAEIYSLKYLAKGDSTLCGYLADSYSATLALYSLCDIGIHYEGWDIAQLLNFLEIYFPDIQLSSVKELYLQILGAPANYLNYYMGYLEIKDLKKDYHANFPDSTEKDFFEDFLSLGPAPFSLLREYLLEEKSTP